MELRQHRILNEQADVQGRLRELEAWVASSVFVSLPLQAQERDRRKLRVMREYAGILAEQVEAF